MLLVCWAWGVSMRPIPPLPHCMMSGLLGRAVMGAGGELTPPTSALMVSKDERCSAHRLHC